MSGRDGGAAGASGFFSGLAPRGRARAAAPRAPARAADQAELVARRRAGGCAPHPAAPAQPLRVGSAASLHADGGGGEGRPKGGARRLSLPKPVQIEPQGCAETIRGEVRFARAEVYEGWLTGKLEFAHLSARSPPSPESQPGDGAPVRGRRRCSGARRRRRRDPPRRARALAGRLRARNAERAAPPPDGSPKLSAPTSAAAARAAPAMSGSVGPVFGVGCRCLCRAQTARVRERDAAPMGDVVGTAARADDDAGARGAAARAARGAPRSPSSAASSRA